MSPAASRPGTTERIVVATFELLAEQGLASITMSAVATRAGISRQTLYNHFANVDSIITAATAAHYEADLQALTGMLGTIPTGFGQLEHLVRHATAAAAQHGAMPELQHGLSPHAQQGARDYDAGIRKLIADGLERGRASGEFAEEIDVGANVILVQHLLAGAAELAAGRPDDVAAITQIAVDFLGRALGRNA